MNYPEYSENIKYLDLCIEYETKLITNKNKDWHYWQEVFSNINQGNEYWYKWHTSNMIQSLKKTTLKDQQSLFSKLNTTQTDKDNMWSFITIGFNPQTITPAKQLIWSKKVSEMKYWTYCDYVLEKHRENGEHHHTHFLVKTDDVKFYYKSKILDKIVQLLFGKKAGDIVLNKQCIDIKAPTFKSEKPCPPFQVCYEYVRGNKREEKLKYVELDDVWRNKNKIDKLFSKK